MPQKLNEHRLARIYYIEKGLTAKEIAEKVGVREQTVGDWVDKGNWKTLRAAKKAGPDKLVNDLKELIALLVEKRLNVERSDMEEEAKRKEVANLGDEISKYNRALETAQAEGKLSLTAVVRVTEWFMDDLLESKPGLYQQLMDFQENWLLKVSNDL